MPYVQPSRADVHIDRPLTNISIAFQQDPEGFVADQVFSVIPVQKASDKYFVYPQGAWHRDEMQKRAPSTESAGGTYDISTDSYSCDEYAFHKDIPYSIRDNADQPINLDREATEYVSLKNLIKKEKLFATNFFATGVWSSEFLGVDSATPGASEFGRWDRDDSQPIEDVRAWRAAVKLKGGQRPNAMAIGTTVWDALLDHPDFVGRIDRGQTSGTAKVMRDTVASLFELDEIHVLDAIENTAIEGATTSNAFIGGKHVLLYYKPRTPGLLTPAAGYTFEWTGRLGGGALSGVISRIPVPLKKSDRVEIESSFVQKKVSADLGFFGLTAVN